MKEIREAIESLGQRQAQFEKAAELQLAVWQGEKPEKQPLLLTCQLDREDKERFPSFSLKESYRDSEKMFANEFKTMLTAAYGGAQAVPSLRANMGCGIFPTLFGVKQEVFDDKMPWIREHLTKERLSGMGVEDLRISDDFKLGLEHMAYMAQMLEGTGCMVYPMDLQGPFDIAHLVYGDAIFYELYDDPEFVHHLLELSCQAIFLGMEECFKVIPDSDKKLAHYNCLVMPRSKGGIKTSEDTVTLLSKDHIQEFVVPYLEKVLSYFGGGWIHYCGKNPHLYKAIMEMPLVYGINFGNPELHDMEYVLRQCAERNKVYYVPIPKKEDESAEEYFSRYLNAAKAGDRCLLLLSYECKKEERRQVLETWEKACLECYC